MILYILRHGIAEDSHPQGDSRRRLTEEGAKKVKTVVEFLKKTMKPRVILSSPYTRAKQTADIASAVLGKIRIELSESLYPDSEPEGIMLEINAREEDEILLAGHDPHMSDLLSWLVCGRHNVFSMKKSAIAAVEFQGRAEAGRGNLKWLVSPALLG